MLSKNRYVKLAVKYIEKERRVVGRKGRKGDFHILLPPQKKKWGINPLYRFRLNATDSKRHTAAAFKRLGWHSKHPVYWLPAGSVFSTNNVCCLQVFLLLLKKKILLPPQKKGGGGVNLKMNQQEKAVHQYSFMQNVHCQEEIETVMSAAFICHLPPGMLI